MGEPAERTEYPAEWYRRQEAAKTEGAPVLVPVHVEATSQGLRFDCGCEIGFLEPGGPPHLTYCPDHAVRVADQRQRRGELAAAASMVLPTVHLVIFRDGTYKEF